MSDDEMLAGGLGLNLPIVREAIGKLCMAVRKIPMKSLRA